jgi:hypothetical protein
LHLFRVLATIDLDYQHRFQADEIQNVASERVLSAKLEVPHLPSPQASPQSLLCVSHFVSEPALKLSLQDVLVGLTFHANPSPPQPSP